MRNFEFSMEDFKAIASFKEDLIKGGFIITKGSDEHSIWVSTIDGTEITNDNEIYHQDKISSVFLRMYLEGLPWNWAIVIGIVDGIDGFQVSAVPNNKFWEILAAVEN